MELWRRLLPTGDWTPTPGETYQGQPTGEKVTISVRTIPDIDADGIPDNFVDEDANGNGVLDEGEDLNGNGVLDTNEDENGNGILDAGEDINGNGLLDMADTEISEPCYIDAIIKLITLQTVPNKASFLMTMKMAILNDMALMPLSRMTQLLGMKMHQQKKDEKH